MKKYSTTIASMLTAGLLLAIAGVAGAQQAYPNKPIRFITAYVPGGTTTIAARLVGQRLSESWGQQVIVENRPGGNTMNGTDYVAKSAADGYTILLATSDHILVPLILKAPYDPIKDFAAVTPVGKTQLVMVINAAVPANNLQEFIALAKSKPGQLNYATPGAGGVQHLATEAFNLMTGIKTQHIPYKGAGQALVDLIGGQVQLFLVTSAAYFPQSKNPKLRAIAITGETRMSALPDVPTFAEAGLPAFDASSWFAVLAPAATPKPIIDKLSAEINKYLAEPEFKESLLKVGLIPFGLTPEQLTALMKEGLAKNAATIKAANIKLEQ